MQNVMHFATNAGHTTQNDGQTMQNDGPLYLKKLKCLKMIFRTLGTKKNGNL